LNQKLYFGNEIETKRTSRGWSSALRATEILF
jgi:hypothetical protein